MPSKSTHCWLRTGQWDSWHVDFIGVGDSLQVYAPLALYSFTLGLVQGQRESSRCPGARRICSRTGGRDLSKVTVN